MTESQNVRVLVVDDDDAIRVMVQRMLERERFSVDLARDGVEALERLQAPNYGAVLLDLMMPRIDGFGVIDHLRQNNPELLDRVVVMTAFSAAARERLPSSLRIITKPFDLNELVQTVRECASTA